VCADFASKWSPSPRRVRPRSQNRYRHGQAPVSARS